MNPRSSPSSRPAAMLEAAARLLAQDGPAALTTRRLAAELGTSTMAVYTHFGGKEDMVRGIVREGFERLARRLADVTLTEDPVADLANLARAYRRSALADPHLYTVMFGGSSVAGFQLSDEDRRIGTYTLRYAVEAIGRCVEVGRLRPADPWAVAHRLWCAVHGLIVLHLSGYFVDARYPADVSFEAQLRDFMIGAGDTYETAAASVRPGTGRPIRPSL